MRNVQIRNVPDHTHAVLRRRAAEAGMSLQEYLLSSLNELAERPTLTEVLDRIRKRSGGRVSFAKATRDIRTERGVR